MSHHFKDFHQLITLEYLPNYEAISFESCLKEIFYFNLLFICRIWDTKKNKYYKKK